MDEFDNIEYEKSDGVATISLDRPEKMNAMSMELIEETCVALDDAEEDDDMRVIVLKGNGAAFSAGWDLGEIGGGGDGVPDVDDWLAGFDEGGHDHLERIYEHDLPVIAAVDGYTVAGGLALACYCDITIAAEDATFSLQAIRMGGYSPIALLPYLTTTIKHVRELWYTGKDIDGTEAARIGLANRAVPGDELMDHVHEIADQIKKVPSMTVTLEKDMLNGIMEMQGYTASNRAGTYLDALAHSTDQGKEFFRVKNEEGLHAAIQWMNEADKE